MALFHRLVNKQRGKLSACVSELRVGDEVFRTEQDILIGWQQHFKTLASPITEPSFDNSYKNLTEMEFREIIDLCQNSSIQENPFSEKEIQTTIRALNKGKSVDIYIVSAEHLVYGENVISPVVTLLLNKLLALGEVPDSLKLGVLSPVFKKKGSNLNAKTYRGITVTPILSKVLESVLRERIKPLILKNQNKLQRGFTEASSPMNCSLILEECI